MVREENDPDDLGRKTSEARRSQQRMYDSLSDLAESYDEGSISADEFKDKVSNIEDRFGVFIEGAEEDYDTVDEFASALNEDITSVSFHYHESGRRDFSKILAAITGGALVSTGAIGMALLDDDEDYSGQPPVQNGNNGTDNPDQDSDDLSGVNLSDLAANDFLENSEGNPDRSKYEGWETDNEEIGEIARAWKGTEALSQFGDDVQEAKTENSSTDLKLGLASVAVESYEDGPELVYEDEDPDAYIGQLFDFDNDIKTSTIFNSERNYNGALELMEDYE